MRYTRKTSIRKTVFCCFSSILLFCLTATLAQANTIYLLRHFEKQTVSKQDSKDVSLTKNGALAADALAVFLQHKNIQQIFSTSYKRTRESVAPSAKQLGLVVQAYDPTDLSAAATMIEATNKNSVIVGHSNTTPELFALLGCYEVSMSEHDYNQIYVVSVEQGKRTCTEFALTIKTD